MGSSPTVCYSFFILPNTHFVFFVSQISTAHITCIKIVIYVASIFRLFIAFCFSITVYSYYSICFECNFADIEFYTISCPFLR